MYLKMYLAGNEQKVWEEIEALKVADLSPEQLADVIAVCQETMRRVKINAERIIATLKATGYDFTKFPDGDEHFFDSTLEEADPEVEEKIKHLESITGPLPLTIKEFWRAIGSISLVGCKEDWPEFSDQLIVASVADNIESIEEWQEFKEECDEHAEDPYILFISPDDYQKDNCEGGQYYNIELPCLTIDGIVKDAPSETTFIDYLREAFEAKGFPGLEEIPEELQDLELLSI